MKNKFILGLATGLFLSCLAGMVGMANAAPLSENFDSYTTGSSMHGQGGWKGWDNNPALSANTSSAYSLSGPNSVLIEGNADLVHEFSGNTSGQWTMSAWQYIPTASIGSGLSYLILLNLYNDGGPYSWSTQLQFNLSTLQVRSEPNPTLLNILVDQWVEIRLDIDLDNNSQAIFYNNSLLEVKSWTEGVSGGGILNIGAIDLFANGAGPVYYDNISLSSTPIPEPATMFLLGTGLVGVAGAARRRKKNQA